MGARATDESGEGRRWRTKEKEDDDHDEGEETNSSEEGGQADALGHFAGGDRV